MFLPNISAAQFDSWQIFASSESKHLHLYALVTMATADSVDEMSCLGHSVSGNKSLQHQKVFEIRLDKKLDFTVKHCLKASTLDAGGLGFESRPGHTTDLDFSLKLVI